MEKYFFRKFCATILLQLIDHGLFAGRNFCGFWEKNAKTAFFRKYFFPFVTFVLLSFLHNEIKCL